VDAVVFIVVFAIITLFWAHRYWRRFKYLRWKWRAIGYYEKQDRLRRGLCVNCGYDLTGNLSGTCPECGTAVPRKREPAG
jgi:hypothetical protein